MDVYQIMILTLFRLLGFQASQMFFQTQVRIIWRSGFLPSRVVKCIDFIVDVFVLTCTVLVLKLLSPEDRSIQLDAQYAGHHY